jgi:hypothetical protein
VPSPSLFLEKVGDALGASRRRGDVHVVSRPVRRTLGLGNHAFVVINPTQRTMRKFPSQVGRDGQITLSGFYSGGGFLRALFVDGQLVKKKNDKRDVKFKEDQSKTVTISVNPPPGMTMDEFQEEIIGSYQEYKNDGVYRVLPFGEKVNSNSFASGLLASAGANIDRIGDKLKGLHPGWRKPLFLRSSKDRRP